MKWRESWPLSRDHSLIPLILSRRALPTRYAIFMSMLLSTLLSCPSGIHFSSSWHLWSLNSNDTLLERSLLITLSKIVLYSFMGFILSNVCVSCSVVCDSATPWTVAHQASLSMEFSRQEYWSGLPFPSPEELPNPRIKPWSPALQADSLSFELQGSCL